MDLLEGFEAIPVAERVVRHGNLITAGGVTSGIDFGLSMIAEVMGQDEAETIQLSLEYAPAPPLDAGLPERVRPEILAAARRGMERSRLEREALLPPVRQERELSCLSTEQVRIPQYPLRDQASPQRLFAPKAFRLAGPITLIATRYSRL